MSGANLRLLFDNAFAGGDGSYQSDTPTEILDQNVIHSSEIPK